MRVITGDGQFGSGPMVKNITTRKKRNLNKGEEWYIYS